MSLYTINFNTVKYRTVTGHPPPSRPLFHRPSLSRRLLEPRGTPPTSLSRSGRHHCPPRERGCSPEPLSNEFYLYTGKDPRVFFKDKDRDGSVLRGSVSETPSTISDGTLCHVVSTSADPGPGLGGVRVSRQVRTSVTRPPRTWAPGLPGPVVKRMRHSVVRHQVL